MNRRWTPSCFGALILLTGFGQPVTTSSQELTLPSVAFGRGVPAAARARVSAVLARPDARFLGGHSLNKWTTLRYGGDTLALNLFLDELVKCPGVTVHVSFKKLADECDWRVGHMAPGNRFQVEVNLSSERVNVEKLYIPEFKSGEQRR